jgi:hypothetical protein
MKPLRFDSRLLIGLGFVLVLLGALLPWLMVLGYLKSSFFLTFFSFTASMAGLMLGIIGVVYYVNLRRKDR